jgi:phosphotransferase system enzyme I (PtsI)
MCGEMAGDPRYIRLLIGMGLREMSMHPSALLEAREVIRHSNLKDLQERTEQYFNQLHEQPDSTALLDELFD